MFAMFGNTLMILSMIVMRYSINLILKGGSLRYHMHRYEMYHDKENRLGTYNADTK